MLIINAFLRFTSVAVQRAKGCFGGGSNRRPSRPHRPRRTNDPTEASRLLSASSTPSLTAHYEDYSHSQSALWLCFFHVVFYYFSAIVGYSFLVDDWPIIDSLYFATVVFTTIGFGDLHPSSRAGEWFTIALALYGIVLLGIAIGILGEVIVDSHNETMERKRAALRADILGALSKDGTPSGAGEENFTGAVGAAEVPLAKEICSILVLEAPIVALVLCLAILIGHVEGWTVFGSIYWAVIAGTSIGLGDYTPETPPMRLACCFFLPFAVAVMGEVLARIASAYMDRKSTAAEQSFLAKSLTLCDLDRMDVDRDGTVDKAEFLTFMLVALQKVSKEDMDSVSALFCNLDKTRTGYLSKQDLRDSSFQGNFRKTLKLNVSDAAALADELSHTSASPDQWVVDT